MPAKMVRTSDFDGVEMDENKAGAVSVLVNGKVCYFKDEDEAERALKAHRTAAAKDPWK